MKLVWPIWASLKTMLKVVAFLTLVLLAIGTVVWTLEHWRSVVAAAFLVGMTAYAYSGEGRRLLSDMHKW